MEAFYIFVIKLRFYWLMADAAAFPPISVFTICGLSSLRFTKEYCCVHNELFTRLLVESPVWFINNKNWTDETPDLMFVWFTIEYFRGIQLFFSVLWFLWWFKLCIFYMILTQFRLCMLLDRVPLKNMFLMWTILINRRFNSRKNCVEKVCLFSFFHCFYV